MSKALDTSRKAVGGGGAKGGGRAGRGARQQLDFIVEGMRSGAWPWVLYTAVCLCVRTDSMARAHHLPPSPPRTPSGL